MNAWSIVKSRIYIMKGPVSQQASHIVGRLLVPDDDDDDTSSKTNIKTQITSAPSDITNQELQPTASQDSSIFRDASHGRRYHAFEERQYWLPNDKIEIDRLDIQHHIWRLSLGGGLHISPIDPESIRDVIDVGTGTGAWAVEFAAAYPDAKVLGTDLSPIWPKENVPRNCTFKLHNAEEEWVWEQEGKRFDLVHGRMLLMGIHDWAAFFRKAYEQLKPEAWLEVSNPEFPMYAHETSKIKGEESLFVRGSELIRDAAGKNGIDTSMASKYRLMLEEQGFVNVREESLQWPGSPWARGKEEKRIGEWMVPNMKAFVRPSAQTLLVKRLGWTIGQVDELVDAVEKEFEDKEDRFYCQM
jgi:SAM-dependent methyltransferase